MRTTRPAYLKTVYWNLCRAEFYVYAEPGCKGNLSLAENFYSPVDPDYRYVN
jgi:hypothetical protein